MAAGVFCWNSSALLDHVIFDSGQAGRCSAYSGYQSASVFRGCTFLGNEAESWGTICLYNCQDRFERCILTDNRVGEGGLVRVELGRTVQICNCTIAGNEALAKDGAVVWAMTQRAPVLVNTIVGYNRTPQVVLVPEAGMRVPKLRYCDLYGNDGGDWTGQIAEQLAEPGNLCADPLFMDWASGDVRLTAGSPCIDAGDPRSPSDPDPDATICDMGAIAFAAGRGFASEGDEVFAPAGRHALDHAVPTHVAGSRSGVCFRFELDRSGKAALEIYDLVGRRVAVLHANAAVPGVRDLSWDGEDVCGRRVGPGIYFWRLQFGEQAFHGRIFRLR